MSIIRVALTSAKYVSGGTGNPPDYLDPMVDDLENMAVDGSNIPAIYDVVNNKDFGGADAPVYIARLQLSFIGTNIQWTRLGNSIPSATSDGMKLELYSADDLGNPVFAYQITQFRTNAEMSGGGLTILQDAAGADLITATMDFKAMFNQYLLLNIDWRLRMTIDVDLSSNTLIRAVASGRVTASSSSQGLG